MTNHQIRITKQKTALSLIIGYWILPARRQAGNLIGDCILVIGDFT